MSHSHFSTCSILQHFPTAILLKTLLLLLARCRLTLKKRYTLFSFFCIHHISFSHVVAFIVLLLSLALTLCAIFSVLCLHTDNQLNSLPTPQRWRQRFPVHRLNDAGQSETKIYKSLWYNKNYVIICCSVNKTSILNLNKTVLIQILNYVYTN